MKRKLFGAGCAIVALSVSLPAQQPPAPPEALDGVDTVLLLKTGKETFGKSAFTSVHGSFTYWFASAETKAEFDAAPAKFAIQNNGLCARMGGTVTGDPSNYAVVDGRIYLFGSDNCRKMFLAAPAKFIAKPAEPMPTSAEAVAKGKKLLERAVAAHGGEALDKVTTYREVHTLTNPTTGATAPISLLWKFPDAARLERTFTMRSSSTSTTGTPPPPQTMTVVTLLRADGAWSGAISEKASPSPVNPGAIPTLQQDMNRQLVPLLRNRNAASTQVAALGPATVDGVAVERVRLRRGGLDMRLNLDPASGRVHSVSWVTRNQPGEFGEATVVYADYRQVDGVLVPFAEKGSFDGAPAPFLTRTLDRAEMNPTLDATLFEPPGRGGR